MKTTEALFNGIIDYAGLFPPAALEMEEAFSRYLRHRGETGGWMLARFVCPVDRLGEIEAAFDAMDPQEGPVKIAVIGRGGDTLDDFLANLTAERSILERFRSSAGERAVADVYEVKLPAAGGAAVAVEKAWQELTDRGSLTITPYFEASLLGQWRPRLPAAVAAVRDSDRKAGPHQRVGFKIRCGGLTADSVPEPEAVAAAVATCRATSVPLKATQGLHQPFRHHDSGLEALTHGFLNLFAAGVLAHARDVPVTRLTEIIAETDPAAFEITEERLAWRDLEASAEEIVAARREMITTFGSCSFSEPRTELCALDLID